MIIFALMVALLIASIGLALLGFSKNKPWMLYAVFTCWVLVAATGLAHLSTLIF